MNENVTLVGSFMRRHWSHMDWGYGLALLVGSCVISGVLLHCSSPSFLTYKVEIISPSLKAGCEDRMTEIRKSLEQALMCGEGPRNVSSYSDIIKQIHIPHL